IVQPGAIIGAHALINTGASVDHDNTIGAFAHISPQAALCGHVEVGEGTHVGAASTVIPKVKIGRWVTIGAGSVVLSDIPDFSVAYGNPARIVRVDLALQELVGGLSKLAAPGISKRNRRNVKEYGNYR
ncbi:MAG: hypothetical protein V3V01_00290, partial [Acidimicrobiales bacterium]